MITAGASAGLLATVVAHGLRSPLLLPRPWFPGYVGLAKALKIETESYVVDGNAGDNFARVVREQSIRAAIWNTPHNPSGRVESDNDRYQLEAVAEQGCLVIEDRAYDELVLPPRVIRCAVEKESHVVVGSLSKSLALAGERVGYVISRPETIQAVSRASWDLLMSVSVGSQQIALQCFADNNRITDSDARRRHRQSAWEISRRTFGASVKNEEDAPFFLWLEFPDSTLTSADLATLCLDRGVEVSPGYLFGEAYPSIRISLVSATLAQIEVGLGLIRDALRGAGLLTDH
ncbi:aspartate/methionine/tyrosine aminotransferase [Mycolicibacterium sp. BK556]|nr:aspartate/methionine/tyrosine aminotransferase [Mycolicibacterium sp. BK556]MBB3632956.1 aspartate/methionine/tyrosine aminotransferase [Mycolicibacterium sp. BK607]